MQLNVRSWGTGPRTALLIHGIMSDSRNWWRVGPELADRGYTVLAPDLRGHGLSPRGEYSPLLWAEDLVDSLPTGADLAIGHSLGGLSLLLAVESLHPKRAVYSDPAWHSPAADSEIRVDMFAQFKHASAEQVRQFHPAWSPEDVDIELATLADWDEATVLGLGNSFDFTPTAAAVPSMVQLAQDSQLVSAELADQLRTSGFEIRVVPGADHAINRTSFQGFMDSLDGWI